MIIGRLSQFVFLKSMDTKTWNTVTNERTPSKIIVEDNFEFVKPRKVWTPTEDKCALGNSYANNVIYN